MEQEMDEEAGVGAKEGQWVGWLCRSYCIGVRKVVSGVVPVALELGSGRASTGPWDQRCWVYRAPEWEGPRSINRLAAFGEVLQLQA